MNAEALEAILRGNRAIAAVLAGMAESALPDGWLVAGAVAQTVWNHRHGLAPEHGIRDIDVIYHDAGDLSAAAEAAIEAGMRARCRGLGAALDVKNQARVHLWYEGRFGRAIAPYASSAAAIASFPTTATAIGVRPGSGGLEICAPFGLTDLAGLVVRANPVVVSEAVYAAKAARWAALWPGLTVLPWGGGGNGAFIGRR